MDFNDFTPEKQAIIEAAVRAAGLFDAPDETYAVTRETLDEFDEAAKCWAEAKCRDAGNGWISWESAQARKSDQRRPLQVIDLGDERAVIGMLRG